MYKDHLLKKYNFNILGRYDKWNNCFQSNDIGLITKS